MTSSDSTKEHNGISMQEQSITPNLYDLHIWKRFCQLTGMYWLSQEKWLAWGVSALLLALMAAETFIQGKSSFLKKDIIDALGRMDKPSFYNGLLLILGVSAAATVVSVFKTYIQETLKINWRLWLTSHLLGGYFENRAYYRIGSDAALDNPDQRLSNNITGYTSFSIDHIITVTQALFNFGMFSWILFGLSPKLLLIAFAYSCITAVITMLLSNRLVNLEFNVAQYGGNLRHCMVHIRNNAESIAFYRGEALEKSGVLRRLHEYIGKKSALIAWERNLSVVTEALKYLPFILPGLLLAPGYFAGTNTLGDITLGMIGFSNLLNALNDITGKFGSLGSLLALFCRVEALAGTLEQPAGESAATSLPVIASREDDRIGMDDVTLMTPDYRKTLVTEVSAELAPGKGLLIAGASGAGKSSLLRAIAGLWNAGAGEITRPPLQEMLFLPQKPYMIRGTLREQLHYPLPDREISDNELRSVMRKVNLEDLAERFDGFDIEKEWGAMLSR